MGVEVEQVEIGSAALRYEEIKDRNLERLRRIEGQVRGLRRMIEEDRYG
jgi:DNA-binding FrmR family transcriptional regulator